MSIINSVNLGIPALRTESVSDAPPAIPEDSTVFYLGAISAEHFPPPGNYEDNPGVFHSNRTNLLPGQAMSGYSEELTVEDPLIDGSYYVFFAVPHSRPVTSITQQVGDQTIDVTDRFEEFPFTRGGNTFRLYAHRVDASGNLTFTINRASPFIPMGPDPVQESNRIYYGLFEWHGFVQEDTGIPPNVEAWPGNSDIGSDTTYDVNWSTSYTSQKGNNLANTPFTPRIAVPESRPPTSVTVHLDNTDEPGGVLDRTTNLILLNQDYVSPSGNHYAIYGFNRFTRIRADSDGSGGAGLEVTVTLRAVRS